MKDLITELEDAIRRQKRRRKSGLANGAWAKDRVAFINLAAWLMTVVETGDADAASQEKDPSGTS